MEFYQKILSARKQKGLTQEQLADLSNVTVRTIQRIESGESIPRAFTLKAIAVVLNISFEELIINNKKNSLSNFIDVPQTLNEDDSKHFLKILCLSCFSYLAIPLIHFLVPIHILKKSNEKNQVTILFAKKIIRIQLYWQATFMLLLLGTLAYNLIMAAYFQQSHILNYLIPFFAMYFINALIIAIALLRIKNITSHLQVI